MTLTVRVARDRARAVVLVPARARERAREAARGRAARARGARRGGRFGDFDGRARHL